jgi:hypothetical protein
VTVQAGVGSGEAFQEWRLDRLGGCGGWIGLGDVEAVGAVEAVGWLMGGAAHGVWERGGWLGGSSSGGLRWLCSTPGV